MKYLCLAYYDEDVFDTLPAAELESLVHQCAPHDEAMRSGGHLFAVASLAHRTATTLHPQNGSVVVTEGHYAPGRHQIGAVFIIESRDLNEAIRVASEHPAAHSGKELGWAIEVRPIETFEQPEGCDSLTQAPGVAD